MHIVFWLVLIAVFGVPAFRLSRLIDWRTFLAPTVCPLMLFGIPPLLSHDEFYNRGPVFGLPGIFFAFLAWVAAIYGAIAGLVYLWNLGI